MILNNNVRVQSRSGNCLGNYYAFPVVLFNHNMVPTPILIKFAPCKREVVMDQLGVVTRVLDISACQDSVQVRINQPEV